MAAGKVRTVEVAVGYTHNLGNYESLRIDVKEGREVADGEDIDAVYAETAASAKQHLWDEYSKLINPLGDSGSGFSSTKIGG